MLIDTINSTTEYFNNFKLIIFLEKIKVIYSPWQHGKIGGDDNWGVHLKLDQSFKADIYFWNEYLIDHKLLYTEIGPTSKSFKEFKLTKRLYNKGLIDPVYITEAVELKIKRTILKKYNSEKHFQTLEQYEGFSKWGKEILPLVTKLFSKGSPKIISINIRERCFDVTYKFDSVWETIYDLHGLYLIINHHDNLFLLKTKYRIVLGYTKIFVTLIELKDYLFANMERIHKK